MTIPNNLSVLNLTELAAWVMGPAYSPHNGHIIWEDGPYGRGVNLFNDDSLAKDRLAFFQGLADLGLLELFSHVFLNRTQPGWETNRIPTNLDISLGVFWALIATGEQLAQAFELIRPDVERVLEAKENG